MLIFENILWLLVLIGVMIMIHELGHFWAARFFDVKVEAFSFGFGPRLRSPLSPRSHIRKTFDIPSRQNCQIRIASLKAGPPFRRT